MHCGTVDVVNLPKVTVALICYNQEKYIEQAFNSCLDQDYPNLKIVVSDDASSDNTVSVVRELLDSYTGSCDVVVNQNPVNLGIGRHFAYLMENLVDGELVVMCAGDDISKPNRVSRIVQEWLKAGKPSLVAHGLEELDEKGAIVTGLTTFQYNNQDYSIHANNMYSMIEYHKYHFAIHFLGAAVAYRIDTYKAFGTPVTYPDCEDHLMYFRALLADGVHYFPEILVGYRKHENGWTSQVIKALHPMNIKSPFLSFFLDKNGSLAEEYFNCFVTHQIVTQQWYDYLIGVRAGKVQIDFELVTLIRKNMLRRHRFLVRNKELWDDRMDYAPPLNAVIFGTALGAKNTLAWLGDGFNVLYACNTDSDLSGKSFFGLKVIDLKHLEPIISEVDCVLVASGYFFKIKKLLMEQANIDGRKIVRVPASAIVGDRG
ncbi:glycosyltransferase [Pseudomonas stutzeri]|uniref:Glycosyltransferase 2-like domain-containing protein n=1 Tax=Stutzerimonas stutzeri TaxID=316 RepID=A0A2N8RZE9_STUST|nr:glycosyltransferase [Stutzerimonas stutzeri]MCQ4295086.1 glycosyltransferase [Stutzerimonas stutzeri]PNF79754.1 hypothetical protein CXK92_14035 [Stutzerimonas stutzeri]